MNAGVGIRVTPVRDEAVCNEESITEVVIYSTQYVHLTQNQAER